MTASELKDLLHLLMSDDIDGSAGASYYKPEHVCATANKAARELGANAVAELLQHAITSCPEHQYLGPLCCSLPVRTLSPTAVESLLDSAIDSTPASLLTWIPSDYLVRVICNHLPGAKQPDGAAVGGLLKRALEANEYRSALHIARLPGAAGAAQLNAVVVGGLLAAAVRCDEPDMVRVFCDLPGAKDVEQEHLADLLRNAKQVWSHAAFLMMSDSSSNDLVALSSTRQLQELRELAERAALADIPDDFDYDDGAY